MGAYNVTRRTACGREIEDHIRPIEFRNALDYRLSRLVRNGALVDDDEPRSGWKLGLGPVLHASIDPRLGLSVED